MPIFKEADYRSALGRNAPNSSKFDCSSFMSISLMVFLSFEANAAAAPAAIPVMKQQGITRIEPFIILSAPAHRPETRTFVSFFGIRLLYEIP